MKSAQSNSNDSNQRLAVYGSLAPGGENHAQLAMIHGAWLRGTVRGRLRQVGDYPALEWDPEGPAVPVRVLLSPQLPEHWARLDAFEGDAYRRVVMPVELASGEVAGANIYVARPGRSAR